MSVLLWKLNFVGHRPQQAQTGNRVHQAFAQWARAARSHNKRWLMQGSLSPPGLRTGTGLWPMDDQAAPWEESGESS